ncbi:helix-turn-helix transcriptional regulator [Streptomyces alkaliterrae]|uniref:helix-turn-helix transcriptional regulator n=1 Tax=Streptomyces alkaliterrae TaxID=2213162 RepID=UPI0016239513|nr:helix-turn-helix transcriptional regulator [Streptomyces alkaliterrae]
MSDHTEHRPAPAAATKPAPPDAGPRERARALRRQGRTYAEIVAEVGVAKSTVSRWVRDLPRPSTPPERLRRMSEARWGRHRREVALRRESTRAEAAAQVGRLSDRELLLVGAGLYWAEGAKSKPYRTQERVLFVNSDLGMIRVYLEWLRLLGVGRERLRFRVMIHETADVAAAERFWAEQAGIAVGELSRTTLKRHRPSPGRRHTGEGYRGCFVVTVLNSADLYRRIEGWWCGIVEAVVSAARPTG